MQLLFTLILFLFLLAGCSKEPLQPIPANNPSEDCHLTEVTGEYLHLEKAFLKEHHDMYASRIEENIEQHPNGATLIKYRNSFITSSYVEITTDFTVL